jgi:glycosyltransferase involved in cell wall biosynthesis
MEDMRVAYLTNVYPKLSHTFIRREIAAIESEGFEVLRISIRATDDRILSQADAEEREKTVVVLDQGLWRIVRSCLSAALTRPSAWWRAFCLASRLGRRSYSGLFRHWMYFVEALVLRSILEDHHRAHVHVHFGTNAATVALLAAEYGGCSFSVTIHGAEEWDKPEFIHISLKVARARFVAAISNFSRAQACRWSDPSQWEKIHVIRCGVDARQLEQEPQPISGNGALLCVGRFVPAKGHLLLLDAVALLNNEGRDFRLELIGDGPMRLLVKQRIEEQGLGHLVQTLGALSEEDVLRRIVASRCMVLPSFIEGLPVTILESLALARPVVATRVAGVPEVVKDGVSGWLVPPGSVEPLADAIRMVLDTPPDRLFKMGLAGREVVRQNHDVRREGRKLALLLRAAID